MANTIRSRRSLAEKAAQTLLVVISVATFVVAFSLIAMKSMISQARYQNKVISQKKAAVKVFEADVEASKKLSTAFRAFDDASMNSIGGIREGNAARDGSNSKIVLDALPSTYDFPAFISYIETLFNDKGVKLKSLTGTDDELKQGTLQSSGTPAPTPIPFDIAFEANYAQTQEVIKALERSIRPIKITTLDITGNQEKLSVHIKAESSFQPAKKFNITKTVIQ